MIIWWNIGTVIILGSICHHVDELEQIPHILLDLRGLSIEIFYDLLPYFAALLTLPLLSHILLLLAYTTLTYTTC